VISNRGSFNYAVLLFTLKIYLLIFAFQLHVVHITHAIRYVVVSSLDRMKRSRFSKYLSALVWTVLLLLIHAASCRFRFFFPLLFFLHIPHAISNQSQVTGSLKNKEKSGDFQLFNSKTQCSLVWERTYQCVSLTLVDILLHCFVIKQLESTHRFLV